jgi:hypothetical protein
MQKAIREPPSKFVSSEIEVQLACRLLFVDMEGLNDGRAVKTIVPQVSPRKMVQSNVQFGSVTDAPSRSSFTRLQVQRRHSSRAVPTSVQ